MSKPLPKADDLTEDFWSATKEGIFRFQQCNQCHHRQFPPRYTCTQCHSTDLSWHNASGHGFVYSFTTSHRAPLAAFKPDVPYLIAIIELDEGVRAMMNLRGVEPSAVAIGMRVQVFFEKTEGEYLLPQARLQPTYTFDNFKAGELLGRQALTLEQPLVDQWVELFPEDRNTRGMPPGMTAVVFSRAYSRILQPRPPGNVHGEQTFTLSQMPQIGDQLMTDLWCTNKTLKGTHRWIQFTSETRKASGELLFSGQMTTLWAK